MELQGYRIEETIGDGGMAVVYKGIQLSLNRPVAIKFLKRSLADDLGMQERFLHESRIIARLNHPNIIHVIDCGISSDGMPYYVMEHVKGVTLEQAMATSALSISRKVGIGAQLSNALSYAHKNGIIHRDVKPANLLIDYEGHIKLADFGIAQSMNDSRVGGDPGEVSGTYAYMPPEQLRGVEFCTAKSDVYAMGILLYQLFVGKMPGSRFEPPSQFMRDIPVAIDSLLQRCLAQKQEDRPKAEEVQHTLILLQQGTHLQATQVSQAKKVITGLKKNFNLIDVLKEDQYAGVYLLEEPGSKQLMVIKKLPISKRGMMINRRLFTEPGPSIARILGASQNERAFLLVMEYLQGGCLADRLAAQWQLGDFIRVAEQMAQALIYAHNNAMVHGNLRPSNVLFDGSGNAKLADFGLEEHYRYHKDEQNWYMPPNELLSPESDIFALGVIFHQMLTAELPTWRAQKLVELPVVKQFPPEVLKLLTGMLALSKPQRIGTAAQALKMVSGLQKHVPSQSTVMKTQPHMKPVVVPPPVAASAKKPPGAFKAFKRAWNELWS